MQTQKYGTLLDVRENWVHGFMHKIDFQMGMVARQYVTLSYFLVGVWLFRSGYVANVAQQRPLLKKCLWWSLGLMFLFFVLMGAASATLPQPESMASWHFMFAMTLYDWGNIAGTAFIISAFLMAYFKWTDGWARSFASYGRTASAATFCSQ